MVIAFEMTIYGIQTMQNENGFSRRGYQKGISQT